MADSYTYDIFLSYRRSGPGNARDWVHNHFYPLLLNCLADQCQHKPEIFIDVEVETGARWPAKLRKALLGSKMLVAVWSPPYFLSPWCQAEWRSFDAREQMLAPSYPCTLLYPVIFSDSDCFPPAARERQARDLKAWSYPHRSFRDTTQYNELHAEIITIATELTIMLQKVPEWDGNWPTCEPELPPPLRHELPEL